MASIVEINVPASKDGIVRCDSKGSAKQVVNITNITGRKVRVGARILADAPEKEKWMKFDPVFSERDLNPNETAQLTLSVQAPAGAQTGKHLFRVEVFSTVSPGEDFTKSDAIAVEIPTPQQKQPDPVPPKPFPWWIFAVIAGVLIVGGIVVYLVTKKSDMVEVPAVKGQMFAQAQDQLKKSGFTVTRKDQQGGPVDKVLEQDPASGKAKKGSDVVLTVGVAAPQPVAATPDLSGDWDSSINFKYRIVQQGNSFMWKVTEWQRPGPPNEAGDGTINGDNLRASWQGANGNGSGNGRIAFKDNDGKAQVIKWDNGVIFVRPDPKNAKLLIQMPSVTMQLKENRDLVTRIQK